MATIFDSHQVHVLLERASRRTALPPAQGGRGLRRLCFSLLAWVCMSGATRAQTPVQLEVAKNDVSGCFTEASLRAELDRRYARPAIASPTSDIVVRIESSEEGEAMLRFSRGGIELGTRYFDALPVDCNTRRAVISVAILVALDEIAQHSSVQQTAGSTAAMGAASSAEATGTAPAKAAQADTRATAQIQPTQDTDQAPSSPASNRTAWLLSASVAFERGLVPGFAAGGRVRLSMLLRRGLSLRLEGWGAGRQSLELGDRLVRVRLLGLGPSVCLSFSNALVTLPLCAGVLAGIAIARGDPGQPESRGTLLPWSAAMLHGSLRLLPNRIVGPLLSVDSFVHLARPRLTAQDESGVTTAARSWPRGGASISLGAEVRLR